MPWKESCAVELREMLVVAMLSEEAGVAELCRRAGVARKTAYKWLERYRAAGRGALVDRSRARRTQPHAVSGLVLEAILTTRREHPTWGVKKILPHLARTRPELALPGLSTAGEFLRRAGLCAAPKRRRRHRGAVNAGAAASHPNHTWTIDFKGQFRLADRTLCYPLTVADAFSRYLLCVDARPGTNLAGVVPSVRGLFQEHGLPERIKSDNGSPFAGSGLARLSRLSVWFMSLGITVQHIAPGRPGQNGSHERMHRTLKAEATRPPGATMAQQQARFDAFRRGYNHERPNEAIGQRPPAMLYTPSPRAYAGDPAEEDVYPGHWERRRVKPDGTIKWRGQRVFIAEPLAGRLVGLVETDEDLWELHYQRTMVGLVDGRTERTTVRDPLRPKPVAALPA